MAQPEPIVYDFKRDQTYEIGAGITVAMCWPLAEDDKLREKQHRNLCCWTLQQLIGDLTGGSRMPWLIKCKIAPNNDPSKNSPNLLYRWDNCWI